jgi:peptidoglycan L-alanyl-D-glutamate endopeptidase CwlK
MPFNKSSEAKLKTCDNRLQIICNRAIQVSKIDFGISCGYRSPEDQLIAYNAGKSKIDGITTIGKHNYSPSKAVDIFGYVNGKADYSVPVLTYLAGIFQAVSFDMGIELRWGGNWDRDGEILTDQDFDDLPHFELT